MFNINTIADKISAKIEEIAVVLMRHEAKNYCLAKINRLDWVVLPDSNCETEQRAYFVVVPSMMFRRMILEREYLRIANEHPDKFGTRNDWDVLQAIKNHEQSFFVHDYSDAEYLEYLSGETMAYVFKANADNTISDRVLRLDLCRGIDKGHHFRGGILHVLKHFSLNEYQTISSNNPEFTLDSWTEICRVIINNFFSNNFVKERTNNYVAVSKYKDGHTIRGVYYKEDKIPVFFVDSLRVGK